MDLKMKYLLFTILVLSTSYSISQSKYTFSNKSAVNACPHVVLQKISTDFKYEMIVDIKIDSVPKFKKVDISKYKNFISIVFNKFPKNNKYIYGICKELLRYSDADLKGLIQYEAYSGSLIIRSVENDGFTITLETKNLILIDKFKNEIKLPHEVYNQVHVGW